MRDIDTLPDCPIAVVLEVISNRWKAFIIRDLLEGKKRFGELKQLTGASQKSLTTNLRELEEEGIVIRKAYSEIPPRVEYSLSDVGMSLAPVLEIMAGWGTDYKKYLALKAKINAKQDLQ